MHTRLIDLYERLRANLWFLPAIMSLAAAALAWILVFADEARLGYGLIGGLRFMGLPPEGARTILQTLATGMITAASLVFSLTFVALTLLSQQLGPRLLLIFMQDRTTQLTLGIFLAGFIHSLLVMGATGTGENHDFVPYVAVMAAIVIAIAAFGALVYFIHHIALFVQADHTLAVIAKELDARIDDLVERGRAAAEERDDGARPPVGEERGQFEGQGTQVVAGRDGYVYLFDFDNLIACARKHDLKLLLDCRPGDFLVTGQPMMRVIGLPEEGGEEAEAIVEQLRRAVTMGSARRPAEDIEFEIRRPPGGGAPGAVDRHQRPLYRQRRHRPPGGGALPDRSQPHPHRLARRRGRGAAAVADAAAVHPLLRQRLPAAQGQHPRQEAGNPAADPPHRLHHRLPAPPRQRRGRRRVSPDTAPRHRAGDG
jgi:uncharacterized membrane protein